MTLLSESDMMCLLIECEICKFTFPLAKFACTFEYGGSVNSRIRMIANNFRKKQDCALN